MTDSVYEKVVKLGDFDQLRKSTDSSSPAARVLKETRELAKKNLEASIARMMEKVDDALFSRAEKAENNQVQTLYFDAMRELRIIREDIESDFISKYCTSFDRGTPRNTIVDNDLKLDWESGNISNLGLVDKETLEEDLAITNMVHKVRGSCTQSLYALDKRIGLLLRDPDLENWCNPLGPEPICNAFKDAAQKIGTGIEIRLVIFKLFDKHVMDQIDSLYREVNQHLVRRGIMPEIKTTIRKSASTPLPEYMQKSNVPHNMEPMHEQGGHLTQQHPHYSGSGYSASATIPANLYQPFSALTNLQHGNMPESVTADEFNASAFNMNDIGNGSINILHGIKQSGLAGNLGRSGDMIIDIVAMLFDYILDDKNIPDAMRALIGRLQIPVLKVAILDRDFFAKKSHPARQLLNKLALSAIEWNEDQGLQDPLFKRMDSIVQTILNDFDDDINLFSTLLDDFVDFLKRDEKEARIREERSAKVMEGQERLEVARSTTMEEIAPRIDNQKNLRFVREFVSTHWKNLLFVTCARHGKDSEEWKRAVETMDALIWSVKPKNTIEDRKKLVTLQPGLLQSIREGMERLSLPATDRDEFISKLIRAHGRTATGKDDEEEMDTGTSTETPDDSVTDQASVNESLPETKKEAITEINDKFMAQARQLQPGTWIEFKNSEGLPQRAKFSWVSPVTGNYLFTDRQGLKSANLTVIELAHRFRNTRAQIINSVPLLDRAVSTVLKDFKTH